MKNQNLINSMLLDKSLSKLDIFVRNEVINYGFNNTKIVRFLPLPFCFDEQDLLDKNI